MSKFPYLYFNSLPSNISTGTFGRNSGTSCFNETGNLWYFFSEKFNSACGLSTTKPADCGIRVTNIVLGHNRTHG